MNKRALYAYGAAPAGSTTKSRDGEQAPYRKQSHRSKQKMSIPVTTNAPDTIKVGAKTSATAAAGAIAGVIRDAWYPKQQEAACEVQAIGAAAVNQAVKAVAIARSYLRANDNLDLDAVPAFNTVMVNDEERTAMRFYLTAVVWDASRPTLGDGFTGSYALRDGKNNGHA